MDFEIAQGLFLPLIGTTLGAGGVFLMKDKMSRRLEQTLSGFAAGVMTAAAIWGLILPSIESSEHLGKMAIMPAFVGFWAGILFLLLLDKTVPHFHACENQPEGPSCHMRKTTMMILAVALHNLPEGMAVGAVYAEGASTGGAGVASAFTLSLGIALQNFPEGAIISMLLKGEGMSKGKAFFYGALSGVVEPAAAIFTMLIASQITSVLPYLLSFAAGAMMYVVVEELVPEMSAGDEHSNLGAVIFSIGFTVMMMMDHLLG